MEYRRCNSFKYNINDGKKVDVASNDKCADAGSWGIAFSGNEGVSSAGFSGMSAAGKHGVSSVGRYGSSVVDNEGVSAAGSEGSATAGYNGVSAAGYKGDAITGNYGVSATGYKGNASAGKNGVACSRGGKVKGGIGCVLALSEIDENGESISANAVIVDGITIKEDTWYTLKNGEFVEA